MFFCCLNKLCTFATAVDKIKILLDNIYIITIIMNILLVIEVIIIDEIRILYML